METVFVQPANLQDFSVNKIIEHDRLGDGSFEFQVEVTFKIWLPETQLAKYKQLVETYLSKIKKNEAATEKERIRECTNKHEEKPSKDLNKHGEKPFKDTIKQGEKPFESFDVDVENLEENKSLKNLDEEIEEEQQTFKKTFNKDNIKENNGLVGVVRKRIRKQIDPSKLWRSKRLKENDEKFAASSFHCESCKKSFRREDVFLAHMLDHEQSEESSSSKSRKSKEASKLSGDLFTATITSDGKQNFKCRLCAHVFLGVEDALGHQRQHDGSSNVMYCGLCDKHFVRRDKFANHLESHRGTTSFECDKCGKCFASLDSASKHKLNLCTAPILYKCPLCEVSYETKELLEAHQPCALEGQVEFRCEPCGETFSVKSVFEEHLRSHEMQIIDPHICETCGIKLPTKVEYEEHVKTHEFDIYKCHCCSETYNLLEDLEMHYQMSETCIEVTCTDCQTNFASTNDLRDHLKEVVCEFDEGVEEEPFVCRFCQRGFHNNDPYVAHLKIHYKDKLKKCDICSETFDSDEKLGIHFKLVHRSAKYPCIECGIIFSDKTNLKKHCKESHAKENIFKCLPCGRTFYQKLEFNRHIVTKQHNKRVIETGLRDEDQPQLEGVRCPICEKVCTNNRELKRHQYDHQRIQSKQKPEKMITSEEQLTQQQQQQQHSDNVSILLNDNFYNFVEGEHVLLATSSSGRQSPTEMLNARLDIDPQGNIGLVYVDSNKSDGVEETRINETKEGDGGESVQHVLVIDDNAQEENAPAGSTPSEQHANVNEETFLALSEMLKQGKIDLASLQVIQQENKELAK